MSAETTKRVNCHKNGNSPLFCIEKDTRGGVIYAPFACVLMVGVTGFEPAASCSQSRRATNCATPRDTLSYSIIIVAKYGEKVKGVFLEKKKKNERGAAFCGSSLREGSFIFFFMTERGADKTEKERVRAIRAALKFRMELHTDVEIIFGDFDCFDNIIIRGGAADDKTGVDETCTEIVIEFVAVTMAFGNLRLAVAPVHLRAGNDLAGVSPEAERTALGDIIVLIGEKVNDLVHRLRVKLARIRIRHTGDAPRKCDDGDLHTEANAEVGEIVCAAIVRRRDLALDPAAAEPAGDDHAVHIGEHFGDIIARYRFRIDPLDPDVRAVDIARMAECLGDRQIGIVELDILADQGDRNVLRTVVDAVEHLVPFGEVDLGCMNMELAADDGGEIALFQHDRRFVQHGQRDVFDHAIRLDIAEHGDLFEDGFLQRLVTPQDDDIRLDAVLIHGRLALKADHGLMQKHLAQHAAQHVAIALVRGRVLNGLGDRAAQASAGAGVLLQNLAADVRRFRR